MHMFQSSSVQQQPTQDLTLAPAFSPGLAKTPGQGCAGAGQGHGQSLSFRTAGGRMSVFGAQTEQEGTRPRAMGY